MASRGGPVLQHVCVLGKCLLNMFFGVFTTRENGSWNANISDVTPSSSLPSVSIAAVNCTSGSGHWWNFGRIQVVYWPDGCSH